MRRLAVILLLLVFVAVPFSASLAQTASCPVGGFSLSLPDSFREKSWSASEAPDLCFYWQGDGITVQGYAVYLGEVAGSDLFQVLTGSETESGMRKVNGISMLYALGTDSGGSYAMYSWMDRGNNVTLYFYYKEGDASAPGMINDIMGTISFDAGH